MANRILTIILIAALIIFGGLYLARKPIAMALVDTMAANRMGDLLADLPDGLHIGLCGTGSPFPDPDRSAPCNVIVAGKQVLLIDVGSGSSKQLARMSLNAGLVDHVFLTHFHSDHIDGLGELMMTRWAQRRENNRLTVHGPKGVSKVVGGFMQAYSQDSHYRTVHHGPDTMPADISGAAVNEFTDASPTGTLVFDNQGLTVTAYPVAHNPADPAVAYRIQYKGRTVVISGDTIKSEVVVRAATKADVLIHEALHPGLVGTLQRLAKENNRPRLAKILADIPDYHTTPVEAAQVAQEANAGVLVYSHIVPPLPVRPLEEIFVEGATDAFKGIIKIGDDGDWFTLPPNSDLVEFGSRYR